jgi:ankyrin repeat protein
VAELLLANHAKVNARDNSGLTPLHEAAYGHTNVVELLLANHAEVNARNKSGLTPLHYAVSCGYKDVAELLHQHGGYE